MTTAFDDAISGHIAEIRALLGKVPPGYPDWSYQQVIEFKKAAGEAATVIAAKSPNATKAARCARALRRAFEA